MTARKKKAYAQAGVDVDLGNRLKRQSREWSKKLESAIVHSCCS